MATLEDIRWFKQQFAHRIAPAVQGSVFDVDMLTAIACQETGELWGTMRRRTNLTVDEIVARCTGDTLDDTAGRRAFPRNKKALTDLRPNGQAMFDIGRAALVELAKHVPAYEKVAKKNHKFCHGYGIFQYDLQFFLEEPAYFLERRYEKFENTLDRALRELKVGLKKLRLQDRRSITDLEFCHVAITYNTGGFTPSRGLKQGHQSEGKFYGEFIRDFLTMARTVPAPAAPAVVSAPTPGTAPLPAEDAPVATGPMLRVDVVSLPLRLRSAPRISSPEEANVKATLPDGLLVRAITGAKINNFIEVEVRLGGRLFRGFASADHLVPEDTATPAPAPAPRPPAAPAATEVDPLIARLPEAHLKHAAGVTTRRTGIATARSLNEADMPRRRGDTPAELRDELARIIDYLGTDKPGHKRYAPRDNSTFCNIYTHDYCGLAGVYLPRVWWSAAALMKITAGQTVEPLLGATVDEVRANTLFRWLRDFGAAFGWRRAASLDELQEHANLGGVALIVARRREEGRSGHIVAVVPETETETAKRDARGRVELALQSQAGAVNFRYGRSTRNWWKDTRFAEAAFWIHA